MRGTGVCRNVGRGLVGSSGLSEEVMVLMRSREKAPPRDPGREDSRQRGRQWP